MRIHWAIVQFVLCFDLKSIIGLLSNFVLCCDLKSIISNEPIDAVNQGNWSTSIKLRLECFVIVAYCKQYAKALTYSLNDSKIQG